MIDAASAAHLEEAAPRALVLSDVHGHCGLRRALAAARRESPVDVLVLLGDFWEQGHGDCGEWRAAVARLARESQASLVVYVEGNHDPNAARCLEGVAHRVAAEYLLPGSETAYYLTHGHLHEREWLEACLWRAGFTGPEARGCVVEWGRRVRRRLRLPGSTWLVLGHTHWLLVDEGARVVHAGALCEWVLPRLSIDWRHSLGYLVLRDAWVEVRRLNPRGDVVCSLHSAPRLARPRGGGGLLARVRALLRGSRRP